MKINYVSTRYRIAVFLLLAVLSLAGLLLQKSEWLVYVWLDGNIYHLSKAMNIAVMAASLAFMTPLVFIKISARAQERNKLALIIACLCITGVSIVYCIGESKNRYEKYIKDNHHINGGLNQPIYLQA